MKIIIAESRADVRSAIRLFLEQNNDISIAGESAKAEDLVSQISKSCPDVLLLDWELPDMAPVKLLDQLRVCCPRLQVIVISGRSEARQNALEAGADAFISKSDAPEQMISVIHKVVAGNDELAADFR